jgi:hypothetical protein
LKCAKKCAYFFGNTILSTPTPTNDPTTYNSSGGLRYDNKNVNKKRPKQPNNSPTTTMSTPSIISQELFDETILENEECFDLSPTEALHETITQFCQQLGYTVPSVVVDCNNDNGNDGNNNEDSSNIQRYDRTQLPPSMTHLSLTHPNYSSNNNSNNERTEMVKFNEALSLLDSCVDDADGRLLLSLHNNDVENNDGKSDNNNNNVTTAVLLSTFSYLSNQLSSSSTKESGDNDGDDALLRYLTVFQQSSAIYTLMSFLRIIQQQQPEEVNEQQQRRQQEEVDKLLILNGVVQTLSTILTTTTTSSPSTTSSSSTTTMLAKRQRIIHQTNIIRNNLRDLFIPALGSLVVNLLFHFQQQSVTTTVLSEQQQQEEEQLQKKILLHLLKLSINSTKGCEGGKVAFVQSSIPPQIVEQRKQQQTKVLTKRGGVQILFYILSYSVYVDSDTTNCGSSGDNSSSGGCGDRNDNSEEIIMNNLQTTDAACQLLSTLCRFDDFRTPSSSTTNNNNSATVTDSSAGTTSSAHDHAMEFHRVNVELLLMKIARGVLNDLSTAVGCGDDSSGSGGGGSDSDEKVAGVLERKEMLAASVLTALRVLAVNDEIIQTMVALGVLPIVTNALQLGVAVAAASDDKSSSTSSIKREATTTTTTINSTTRSSTLLRKHRLTAASLGLLRNLCGNDEIKTNLCLGSTNTNSDDDHHQSSALSISSTPSALPHLLHAMERYPTISPIQEHACGTLAAMALRRPVNARAIIDAGGPRLIITAMKRHDEVVSVQRQGALAIRNIVSRILKDLDGSAGAGAAGNATSLEDARSEIRDRFHELGVEDVLRNITGRHQGSVDEAYAALRDLGYSASLTKFNAEDLQDGTNQVGAVSRTMMFGEKHNSNFRPVYDESAGLNNAVYDAMSNLST